MQKTTVGSIELVALVDLVQTYPVSAVYPDIGDPTRFAGYLDAESGVALGFACYLLRDGSTTLLVDTGWGPENNGRLLAELAEAGVKPGQVSHVIFTHLHGDHTGWNIDRASGRPLFPAARYLVPQKDWDEYGKGDTASFERDVRPLEGFGCLDLFDGERTISSGLNAVPTPGHTPGHTSVAVTSAGARGFILGDVVLTPIDAEEPGLESVFDGDRQLAVATRRKTLQRLVEEDSLVAASHLPPPGLGRFVRTSAGQAWAAM
jgi:glyoxylase-like metal-dependent hydrolase (beta-lactamase superfamily II)